MTHLNRFLWVSLLVIVLLPVLFLGGRFIVVRLLAESRPPIGAPLPATRFAPEAGQVYLGVSTHGIADGVDQWDRAAGITGHPALYGRWTEPNGPFAPILNETATRQGITPIVHWNLPFTGGRIADGSQDAYVKAQAEAVKTYNRPVFVRLNWEMNTDWYPGWNPPAVPPADYVAAWRHVVALFADVPNVAFVWAPNVFTTDGYQIAQWYPGDAYVDWIGLDAYPQSAPPSALLNGPGAMEDQARFAEERGKPLMLAEWAVNSPHPDSADPVNLVFDWAARHPVVRALVYFDFDVSGKDYRLSTHPVAAAAFRARTAGKETFLLSVPGVTDPAGHPTAGVPAIPRIPAPSPVATAQPAAHPP